MNLKGLSARQLALDLLKRSTCKVQMAAVLSDKYGIFSWGWNHDYTHAEEHAIMRANPQRIKSSTITVAGQRAKSRNYVLSFPCTDKNNCLHLIRSRGILVIEYMDEGQWYKHDLSSNAGVQFSIRIT